MDIRTLRLIEAFNNSGYSQTDLCKKTGITKGAMSSYLSGRYLPKQTTLEKLADALHVDILWLMAADEKKIVSSADLSSIANLHTPGAYRVPILGKICAGNGVLTEEDFKGYFFLDGSIKCDFILDVAGDSMEDAGIYDGDKVMLEQTYEYAGKICGVILKDSNEAVLKRVDATSGQLVLTSFNSNKNYAPIVVDEDDVLIVGECVGVYHSWE